LFDIHTKTAADQSYHHSGIFFFVGPVLLILTVIFEWIMGNFFSMMVCGLFAVFWLSFGMLQLPTLGLAAPYSTTGTNAVAGAATKQYNAVIALYLIIWGFALFTYFIFTLKTNVVFAAIFLFVTMACWVLSGAYWKVSNGEYATAHTLQVVSFESLLHLSAKRPISTSIHWRCGSRGLTSLK
jgi:succinate-acetate transporter protein